MPLAFIDTNVFIRHLTQDHPVHSPQATAFFARIERGELRARIADTVVFETVFTLQKHYGATRTELRDALLPLLELSGIVLPGKQRLRRAFDLYVEHNLSFGDAFHAALVEQLKLKEIVSFDRGFDRVPGLRRVEPS